MASNAEWSLGDHIEMGDGATPTEGFTRIPEIKTINFTLGTRTKVDTTSHDSTAPFKDQLPTFLEGGTITLSGNYLPGNSIQTTLEGHRADGAPTNFKLVIDVLDGHTYTYTGKGWVTAFNTTHDAEDARRLSVTIDPTGAWVRTVES